MPPDKVEDIDPPPWVKNKMKKEETQMTYDSGVRLDAGRTPRIAPPPLPPLARGPVDARKPPSLAQTYRVYDRYNVIGEAMKCDVCDEDIKHGDRYFVFAGGTGYVEDERRVCIKCEPHVKVCDTCLEPFISIQGEDMCEDCFDADISRMGTEAPPLAMSRGPVDIVAGRPLPPGTVDPLGPPASLYPPNALPQGTVYVNGVAVQLSDDVSHPDDEYVTFRKGNVQKRIWVGKAPGPEMVSKAISMAASGQGEDIPQTTPDGQPIKSMPDDTTTPVPLTLAETTPAPVAPESLSPPAHPAGGVDVGVPDQPSGGKKRRKVKNGNGYDNNYTYGAQKNASGKKTYTSDLSDYRIEKDKCGYCEKDADPLVTISMEVWSKAIRLMKACDLEWLGYLIGVKMEDGNYEINDIVIPLQEVSSGACENKEAPPAEAIGIIHSHHTMFKAHSGIDDGSIDQQNNVSIVVSTKGATVTVRKELPCGRFMVVPARYEVMMPAVGDLTTWIDESKRKMTTKYPQWGGYQQGQYPPYNRGNDKAVDQTDLEGWGRGDSY